MKLDVERIILWAIIAILIFMVFQQRRSGYVTMLNGVSSNVISIFDLMEFSGVVNDDKLNTYKEILKLGPIPMVRGSFSDIWNNVITQAPVFDNSNVMMFRQMFSASNTVPVMGK